MSHSKSRGQQRTGHGRRAGLAARTALASLAVAGLAAVAPTAAHAGSFEVSQCKSVGLTPGAFAGYTSALWDPTPGVLDALVASCATDGSPLNVHQANRRINANEDVTHRFTLPASMANTTLSGLHMAYTPFQQWSGSGNPAFFMIKSAGSTLVQHDMTGVYSTSGRWIPTPNGARSFDLNVWCSPINGPGYCNWAGDTFQVSGLTMTLTESVAPATNATGPLTGAGEQSGTRPLDISASDADSGVKRIDVTLDGVDVGSADFSADCRIDRFHPCLTNVAKTVDVDTTKVADGSRLLRLVASDLAGNARTVNLGYVAVENVPAPSNSSVPTIGGEKRVNRTLTGTPGTWSGDGLSYAYRWERYAASGWENIPDATQSSFTTTRHETGMRLRLKVTATNPEGSTVAYSDATNPIVAPGPTDADGDFDSDGIVNANDPDYDNDGTPNESDAAPFDPTRGAPGREGTKPSPIFETPSNPGASPGAKLVATFDGTRSRIMKVRYGAVRHITGTLQAASGAPIGGAQLSVTSETLAMGAKPLSAGTVMTDPTGRFRVAVPVGASRRIQVAYKWFRESAQYTHMTTVTVNVVPRVTMKADRGQLRNRQSVRFAGKVAGAPRGARKVVELQARVGRSWQTFGTARLGSNGTFAYRYRFTRTSRPTVYAFRANVKAERGWPFLSGQSRATKVLVRP